MADSGHVPADGASSARSSSDSDDEEIVQAFKCENPNNGSNSDHDNYCCNHQSRDESIYQTKEWLRKCVDEVINDAKRSENREYNYHRNNDNGVHKALYGHNSNYEAGSHDVANYNSGVQEDDDCDIDEGCVGRELVENGDYDSGSTEGCDGDDDDDGDDDLIDEEEDFIDDEEDTMDDDGPTEGCDVADNGTADDRDDGGNGSTERGDTANENSETSRKSAFFRFLERSNAFIRHMVRKAFDPPQ